MRKSLPAVLVVAVALGMLVAPMAGAANISNVQADDYTMEVEEDGQTDTHEIEVTNDGENDTVSDVTISQTPSGVSVSGESTTLSAGSTTDVELSITSDIDAESGTVAGDVNGEPFEFELEVETPPLAGFENEPLDLGDVLVDETTEGTATVEEVSGENDLSGVDIDIIDSDSDATLGFSGEGSVSGSSGTVDWDVTVDDGVSQYETLEWTVEMSDGNSDAVREVDVEAEVIYPGYFGDLDLSDDEIVFDEPRSDGNTITRTIDLEIPNDGDQPLEIDGVSAFTSETGLSVDVSSTPNEIGARSTADAALVVTASRDLPEGEYDLSADVDETGFDGDEASYDGGIEIIHETRLVADDAAIGEVPIGEGSGQTVTVSEELGYNDVDDIETTLRDGPDDWLTLERSPGAVDAGETESASFTLEFDTTAEFGSDYQWTYDLDGDNDDTTITVTASPIPLDLDPIRDSLGGYDTPVTASTLELVNAMDDRIQSGESGDEEISIVLTFGEAATLYASAVEDADERIDEGENDEAQSVIIRAAAAYNTMGLQANRLEDDELRGLADAAQADAESDLDRLIDTQEQYYEERLESGEMSLIEEATAQRQLARIAVLQGDEDRAAALENDAEAAFERYSDSVSEGERSVQAADDTWAEMESEQFVMVFGQPILLNPANYDAFVAGSAAIDDSYADAISAFDSAGETPARTKLPPNRSRGRPRSESPDTRCSGPSACTRSSLSV